MLPYVVYPTYPSTYVVSSTTVVYTYTPVRTVMAVQPSYYVYPVVRPMPQVIAP